jgi:hypothetical protein
LFKEEQIYFGSWFQFLVMEKVWQRGEVHIMAAERERERKGRKEGEGRGERRGQRGVTCHASFPSQSPSL